MGSCDGALHDAKLDVTVNEKIADETTTERPPAHRDQRPEISLLALFSYDKLSTVAREKGWI